MQYDIVLLFDFALQCVEKVVFNLFEWFWMDTNELDGQ